jgi:hypothetical protein
MMTTQAHPFFLSGFLYLTDGAGNFSLETLINCF